VRRRSHNNFRWVPASVAKAGIIGDLVAATRAIGHVKFWRSGKEAKHGSSTLRPATYRVFIAGTVAETCFYENKLNEYPFELTSIHSKT